MEQLILDLAQPEAPTFQSFVAGSNREAVAMLLRLSRGAVDETGIVVWGPPGVGKTHLLRAVASASIAAGRPARYVASPREVEPLPTPLPAVVCVDAIDAADETAQGRLFTLYNALAAARSHLVAAALCAPIRLALRDDLRTRLAHGLVYEIGALQDDDKAGALRSYANERGFQLSVEVIDYLLAHGRRDMATLVATLAALDRHSLASKRPITVPLLREWMERQAARRTDVRT